MTGPDEAVAIEAAKALARQAAPEALEPLLDILHNGASPHHRAMAAYALRDFREPRSVEPLVAAMQDAAEAPHVRGMAAESLGEIGDRRAVAPLISALAEPEAEVRFWAAFALGSFGVPAAIPALKQLAASDTAALPGWWDIRKEALDAISRIEQASPQALEAAK